MPDEPQASQETSDSNDPGCGCKAKAAAQGQPTEVPAMTPAEAQAARANAHLHSDWIIRDDPGRPAHVLYRGLEFPSFKAAMDFVSDAGYWAERLDHHPVNIQVVFRLVHMLLMTNKADGLTQADFDLAAKIDEAARKTMVQ